MNKIMHGSLFLVLSCSYGLCLAANRYTMVAERTELRNILISDNIFYKTECTSVLDCFHIYYWGRRGRNRMVIGFTTTYAISAYHHWCCEFESRSEWGAQHYVIKFVSKLRQVSGPSNIYVLISKDNDKNIHLIV
jgi:hypothetical protein